MSEVPQSKFCEERKEACDQRLEDLRDLFLRQSENFEKAIKIAREAQEKNITVATKDLDRRLESMNEFREQLRQQAGSFLTTERYEIEHKALTNRFETISLWKANLEGKQSWTTVISIMAVIVSAIAAVLHMIK